MNSEPLKQKIKLLADKLCEMSKTLVDIIFIWKDIEEETKTNKGAENNDSKMDRTG